MIIRPAVGVGGCQMEIWKLFYLSVNRTMILMVWSDLLRFVMHFAILIEYECSIYMYMTKTTPCYYGYEVLYAIEMALLLQQRYIFIYVKSVLAVPMWLYAWDYECMHMCMCANNFAIDNESSNRDDNNFAFNMYTLRVNVRMKTSVSMKLLNLKAKSMSSIRRVLYCIEHAIIWYQRNQMKQNNKCKQKNVRWTRYVINIGHCERVKWCFLNQACWFWAQCKPSHFCVFALVICSFGHWSNRHKFYC